MSRPRYWWYRNVCAVIAAYPGLCARIDALDGQSVVASSGGMPHGAGAGRPAEDAALRAVCAREYDDCAAVRRAVDAAREWADGEMVLEIVRLWHWTRVKNFDYIADRLHMSERTVRRYNARFVYEVARNLGYSKKLA